MGNKTTIRKANKSKMCAEDALSASTLLIRKEVGTLVSLKGRAKSNVSVLIDLVICIFSSFQLVTVGTCWTSSV